MIRIDAVIEALFAGAAAGAAVIGTAFALAMIAPAIAAGGIPSAELPYGLFNLALFSGYALIAAFILFLIGMALLGAPRMVLPPSRRTAEQAGCSRPRWRPQHRSTGRSGYCDRRPR